MKKTVITHNGGRTFIEAMMNSSTDFKHSFDLSKSNILFTIQFKGSEVFEESNDDNVVSEYSDKEFVCIEIKKDKKKEMPSGIITFSTDVKAKNFSDNKAKNFFIQKFKTYSNRVAHKNILGRLFNKKSQRWVVGKFMDGVYTTDSSGEQKSFNEKSLSIAIYGFDLDSIFSIAKDVCLMFDQESVLIDDCVGNKTWCVNYND